MNKNLKGKVPYEFNPDIRYYFYFVRRGLLKGISKHKHHLEGGRLMDFGCGSKPYKNIIDVKEYIGVDFDGEGHSHENEQIDVFYDGKTIPFPDNHFDAVLTTEVMEHVFEPDATLKEINRVMKPGAKILITCPFVFIEHEVPVDYARYTHFALKHLLEKNGFEVLVLDKAGNFITTLFQMWMIYCMRFWLLRKFKEVFAPFVNIPGIIADKILPGYQHLYQNNIVVAQKK
jgi:SAM-dependent methyltransferase